MTFEQFARACRYLAPPLAVAAVCLSLAACGGGEQYLETTDADLVTGFAFAQTPTH